MQMRAYLLCMVFSVRRPAKATQQHPSFYIYRNLARSARVGLSRGRYCFSSSFAAATRRPVRYRLTCHASHSPHSSAMAALQIRVRVQLLNGHL